MLFDAGVSAVHVGVHTEFNHVAVGSYHFSMVFSL